MAIYISSSSILIDSGAIATDVACCCGGAPVCDLTDGADLFVEFCNRDHTTNLPNEYASFFDVVYDLTPVTNSGIAVAGPLAIADRTLGLEFTRSGGFSNYSASVDFTNLEVSLNGNSFKITGSADWEDPTTAPLSWSGTLIQTFVGLGPSGCKNVWQNNGISVFDGSIIHAAGATLNGCAPNSKPTFPTTAPRWGITYANDSGDLDCSGMP